MSLHYTNHRTVDKVNILSQDVTTKIRIYYAGNAGKLPDVLIIGTTVKSLCFSQACNSFLMKALFLNQCQIKAVFQKKTDRSQGLCWLYIWKTLICCGEN